MSHGTLSAAVRRLARGGDDTADAHLLARYLAAGDEAAFAELVGRHGPLVWAVCRQSLPAPADAEDAFQATFLALVRSGRRVRGALAPWLHGVAVRACARLRRDAARRRRREHRAASPEAGTPVPDAAWERLLAEVHAAVQRLPAGPRAAFVLCDLQGTDPAAAAARLGCSPGTLAVRRTRARQLLLGRLGLAPAAAAPLAGLAATAAAAVPDRLAASVQLLCGRGAVVPPALQLLSAKVVPMALPRLALLAAVLAGVTGLGVAAYPSKSADPPAPPAGAVTGRVVADADGSPVAGADVRLVPRETGSYTLPLKPRKATSDAAGGFAFPPLPPGKYLVAAFAGGKSSRTKSLHWATVEVPAAGQVKPLELRLKQGVPLRVRVLAAADGRPVPGAVVRFGWSDHDRDHTTDAAGEVMVPYLTAQKWNLQAGGPGLAAVGQVVDLSDGEPAATEFRLPPGGAVAGTVAAADGRPLAGVNVSARSVDGRGGLTEYLTTGLDGRFRLDWLPVGAARLSLSKMGMTEHAQTIAVAAGGEERFAITLRVRPNSGSVRGVVTDAAGKPVAGAELLNHGMSSSDRRRAVTAADGSYRLDDVFRGSTGHELVVRAGGQSPRRLTFEPGPADAPAMLDIKLDPGHRIAARVVDPAGKPVRGAQVYAAEGRYGMVYAAADATTGADGRFRFDNLPADCPITIRAAGFSEVSDGRLKLDGDAEVVVTLKPEGAVTGLIFDAETGRPVTRFTVGVTFSPDRQPGDPVATLPSDLSNPGTTFAPADGWFAVGKLVAGMPLQVSVTADGYRRRVLRRVVAGSADDPPPEIALTRQDPAKALTVRGKLLDHTGKLAAGVELRLVTATDRPERRDEFPFNWQMIENGQVAQAPSVLQFQTAATAADGGFEFRGVPDGAAVTLAYWGKGVPIGRLDDVETRPAAERAALVVRAATPARLVGTLDRAAFPAVGSVEVYSGDRSYKTALTADGGFTVEDLAAGRYAVLVQGKHEPGDPAVRNSLSIKTLARKEVTVKAGEELRVTLSRADAKP